MSPPGPKSSGVPRMGDSPADLARRTDRMDLIEMRLGRVEAKLDRVLEAVLGLSPNSVPRQRYERRKIVHVQVQARGR